MKNLIAQTTTLSVGPKAGTGNGLIGLTGINAGNILSGAISLILIVAALLFFFMLVIGGIRWIMSGGDKGATEAARNQITAALIGLVIVFAAWAIATLLGNLFGITIFSGSITLPSFT